MTDERCCWRCQGYHEPRIDCERRVFHDDEIELSARRPQRRLAEGLNPNENYDEETDEGLGEKEGL